MDMTTFVFLSPCVKTLKVPHKSSFNEGFENNKSIKKQDESIKKLMDFMKCIELHYKTINTKNERGAALKRLFEFLFFRKNLFAPANQFGRADYGTIFDYLYDATRTGFEYIS